MNDLCLYHSDKCHFDIVSRDIEKAKIMARVYTKRLAMCVCSCRKNRFNICKEVKQLELQDMAHYLENYTTKWPLSLATLIKPLLKNVCLQKYSQSMIIWVLYLAVKEKDYHLLESLMKKKTLNGPNKEQKKITPTQFQLMLNKKWKNSAHFLDLCVAMFAGNCKLLQSDDKFKQLQLGHKDVVIKIDHEKNTGYMEKNLKKTIIKLAGQKKDEVHDIGCKLSKIASGIQDKLDRKRSVEFEKRKEAKILYKQYCGGNGGDSSLHNTAFDDDYKDNMTDFYIRRCNADRIGYKMRTAADSPLKDGHCINCLDKFITLKNPDDCKYHPGFIGLDSIWSCCGIEAKSEQPSLHEHRDTGCFIGVHNWRHGKDLRKTKKHRNVSKTFKTAKQRGRKFPQYTDDIKSDQL